MTREPSPARSSRRGGALDTLGLRDYRFLALYQLLGATAVSIQAVGTAAFVLREGGGGLELGLVAAAQTLPVLLIVPWAGVLADFGDRRRTLMAIQASVAVGAGVLALLSATGHATVRSVTVFGLVQGALGAVSAPTHGAFTAEVVGRARIASTASMQELWINSGRIVGPLLAAVLVVAGGSTACFAGSALCCAAASAATSRLPSSATGRGEPLRAYRHHIAEATRYALHTRVARTRLLLALAVGNFFNFGMLLPLIGRDVLHSGPESIGVMMGVVGAGALVGSLALASAGDSTPRRITTLGPSAAALVACCGLATSLPVELAVLACTGAVTVALVAATSGLLLTDCPPHLRGRVLSLWSLCLVGGCAVTGPALGLLADLADVRVSLVAIASALLLASWRATRAIRHGVPTPGPLLRRRLR